MKLPALLTADLHLTASPQDAYRWRLFEWLRKTVEVEQVQSLLILGDVTDQKDRHPAELVNRLVRELTSLKVEHTYILRGNHDTLKDSLCFFEFLSELPKVKFITSKTELNMDDGPPALLLPHTRTPGADWANYTGIPEFFQYVFMHQTYKGAKSSNGQALDGDSIPDIFGATKVFSGDIHVPQIIGPVEYVGSPYHVHFGDTFTPRCVLLDRRNRPNNLFPELMQKHVIDAIADVDYFYQLLQEGFDNNLRVGDQVKLRIHLSRSEAADWPKLRREMAHILTEVGLEVCAVEMVADRTQPLRTSSKLKHQSIEQALIDYAESEQLGGSMLDTGLDLLETTQ